MAIDSATAQRLIDRGFTAGTLKALSEDSLHDLGLLEFQIENILASSRPPIPEENLSAVLFKSKWTCCICRDSTRAVIVHHLSAWSESRSHSEDNLVILCLEHHGEAHTIRQLSLTIDAGPHQRRARSLVCRSRGNRSKRSREAGEHDRE